MAKFLSFRRQNSIIRSIWSRKFHREFEKFKSKHNRCCSRKHLPVVTQEGNKITVAVSSVEHPMLPEHYIMGVYIETKNGGQLHKFAPGDKPEAVFMLAMEMNS